IAARVLIETAHGHVFDQACPQWADGTLGGIGGYQGFLSRAEGCWTFDARDRTPRSSRATAHHLVENAPTQTRAPSRASGFVLRREGVNDEADRERPLPPPSEPFRSLTERSTALAQSHQFEHVLGTSAR